MDLLTFKLKMWLSSRMTFISSNAEVTAAD
jgi:hypothetical protein